MFITKKKHQEIVDELNRKRNVTENFLYEALEKLTDELQELRKFKEKHEKR